MISPVTKLDSSYAVSQSRLPACGLTVAARALDVAREVVSGHGLAAARALLELGAAVTFTQKMLRETGDLNHLRTAEPSGQTQQRIWD